jgi:hypothetical protein
MAVCLSVFARIRYIPLDCPDYNMIWNASGQSSGMYLIRAKTDKQTAMQKVLLLK